MNRPLSVLLGVVVAGFGLWTMFILLYGPDPADEEPWPNRVNQWLSRRRPPPSDGEQPPDPH